MSPFFRKEKKKKLCHDGKINCLPCFTVFPKDPHKGTPGTERRRDRGQLLYLENKG